MIFADTIFSEEFMSEFSQARKVRRLPKPMAFPEKGIPQNEVLHQVVEKLSENIPAEQNFCHTYAGPPHPFAKLAWELAQSSLFVSGWGEEVYRGTHDMEVEAVRMVSSLLNLNNEESFGFITSGGTESNLLAIRTAKLLAEKRGRISKPEIVMPYSAHFSLRLAADLFGIKVREVELNDDFTPKMDQVEALINENTIALACSAPEPSLQVLDPIPEFSRIAERKGIYLHVDAAFGGFLYPFIGDFGYSVPKFDFSLPGVCSMMTDSHKLGLVPIACSFVMFRENYVFDDIPTERLAIHTITSTKNGGVAAAAWGLFKVLGREGYKEYIQHALELSQILGKGIADIKGLQLLGPKRPCTVLGCKSTDGTSVEEVFKQMLRRQWGVGLDRTPGPTGAEYLRISFSPMRQKRDAEGFIKALEESVRAAKT